ncbi:MAG: hypothetical protein RMY34_04795 [Aulosira sp. DedQUE10]|nr:hypothetical protein [Aulosira sp. DedQUE10]
MRLGATRFKKFSSQAAILPAWWLRKTFIALTSIKFSDRSSALEVPLLLPLQLGIAY